MRLTYVLFIIVFCYFSLSGATEKGGLREGVKKVIVEKKSLVKEKLKPSKVIQEMSDEMDELYETTCKLKHLLINKGKGENRDERCKRGDSGADEPATRGRDTHRGGNGFDQEVKGER